MIDNVILLSWVMDMKKIRIMVSTTKSSCNNPNFGQTLNLIRSNACIISQPVNLRLIKHVAIVFQIWMPLLQTVKKKRWFAHSSSSR